MSAAVESFYAVETADLIDQAAVSRSYAPISAYERGVQDLIWSISPPTVEQRILTPDQANEELRLPVIADDKDLDAALLHYFGAILPNKRCCKNHRTPWEAFHDAFFARGPIAVWKGSRGFAGKSFTLALLALMEAIFLRADVNVLGGSGIQSKRLLEHMNSQWEQPNAPRAALRGDPGTEKQTFIWGNTVQALMASQKSVRGPHPQRLRMDEVDEIKIELLDAALPQPMSKGWVLSHVVLSSTHQYPDGTFTEIQKRAKANGWPFYEWCYRETMEPHGWLSLGEVERKRAILTKAMWDTEIEGQEPSSEGRAIETEKVEGAFRTDLQLEPPAVEEQVQAGQYVTVVVGKYGTGSDWAKKKNHTVIITIRKDVRPMRVVAIKRTNKEPWPNMAGHLDERIALYGGTSTHDNTGIGQVVHDLLNHDSDPFNMVGKQRADLLSEYIAAIEKGDLLWPKAEEGATGEDAAALQAAYGEHKYATRDDVYKGSKDGTGSHHLPDTVSAGALAWRAASQEEATGVAKNAPQDTTGRMAQLKNVTDRMRATRFANRPGQPVEDLTQPVEQPKPPEEPAITRTLFRRKPDPEASN